MNYVGEKPVDVMTLDIYPGPATEFELYEDDGKSLDYQHGAYATTKISCQPDNKGCKITMQKPAGKFTPSAHTWLIKLHVDGPPTVITENNNTISRVDAENALNTTAGWYYDAAKQIAYIKTSGNNRGEVVVKVN
jgi:hypothetical protein